MRGLATHRARAAALGLGIILGGLGSAGCGRSERDLDTAPGPSGSASSGPAVESTLFAKSRSLLLDAKALELLPKEAAGVVVVQPVAALAAIGSKRFSEPAAREAIMALAREVGREVSKDLPALDALEASGIDPNAPMGVAWLDDEGLALAFFATVADAAKAKAFLEARRGKRQLVEKPDALILLAKSDVTRAVVLRRGQLFVLRAGASWASARDDRIATLADRIATLGADQSLAADPSLRATAEQLAWGRVAAGWLTPSMLGAEQKARLRPPPWETTEPDRQARIDAELAEIAQARARVTQAAAGVCFGIEPASRGVLVRAEIVPPVGRSVPSRPTSSLPAALAELRDVNLELHVATDPSLLAALGRLDAEARSAYLGPLECALGAKWAEDLTGEVVRLGGGTLALGVTEAAAAHLRSRVAEAGDAGVEARPDASSGVPPYGLVLDEATGVAQCRGKHLRIAEGWLVLAEGDGMLRRFPLGASDPSPGARPAVTPLAAELRTVAPYHGSITLFPWPTQEPGQREELWSLLDSPCGMGLGGLLFRTEKETAEERGKLCEELGKLERAERERARDARAAIGRLLGRVELVAKPRGIALDLFGGWHYEGQDLAALVSALLDAWLPVAPTSAEARKIRDIEDRIEKIDEQSREAAFGDLLSVGELDGAGIGSLLGSGAAHDVDEIGLGGLGGLGTRGGNAGSGSAIGGGLGRGGLGTRGQGASAGSAPAPPATTDGTKRHDH